ncbi:hypothetical protein SAE01_08110 [Segetibacter aerophilus]|uniref:DUF5131 family protein n=1 Tax=Segetibacter aerophilus TaxID=670293 RepID=A0A512B8M3_9BACT|nr:hypothetical protein SAE01_08110 [Segetibacter aerophilus]
MQVNGKRFLSVEPQLDAVYLRAEWIPAIDWVIVGGESGHGRRPYDADWGRMLRDQCKEAGIPFFMKQIDKVLQIPRDLLIMEFPRVEACA